jgi:hypothetical protein
MKIVDSFLFSEVYEKELLLLKFILEDECVTEWILLENAYSFQGEYTGLHAQKLIDSDDRFIPYKHKLTIISKEQPTEVLPKNQFLDHLSYKVEFWQRDLAYDYFMEKYTEDDWIMIVDVDEMIDFTDADRRNELLSKMAASKSGLINVPAKRYWYDFDNEYRLLMSKPMCSKKYLLKTGKKLHHVRAENIKTREKGWKNIISFEYSSCYDTEYMLRKFYTSTHTGFNEHDLRQSLRCNMRPISSVKARKAENNKRNFFETAVLTQYNSPKYVRDNLAFYKTNAINADYKKNRREDYPELFTVTYHIKASLNPLKEKLLKTIKRLKKKLFKK